LLVLSRHFVLRHSINLCAIAEVCLKSAILGWWDNRDLLLLSLKSGFAFNGSGYGS
jgi:hypothetical protein